MHALNGMLFIVIFALASAVAEVPFTIKSEVIRDNTRNTFGWALPSPSTVLNLE